MNTITTTVAALAEIVAPARAARAAAVSVLEVKIKLEGSEITGFTARTGEGGKYATRLTLSPRRGFHCTCPDLQQRRVACKHVVALATRVTTLVA